MILFIIFIMWLLTNDSVDMPLGYLIGISAAKIIEIAKREYYRGIDK